MKTLAQIAKEFNLFDSENIPATHKEYFKTMNPYKHTKAPEGFVYSDKYETGVFYKCQQDTDYLGNVYYFIEHSYFLVKPISNDLFFVITCHKKKYSLYPYWSLMRKIEQVEYHKRSEAVKGIKEPNSIGVFTEKKVLDWINYRIEWYGKLIELYDTITGQNNSNIEKIQKFAKDCGGALRNYKDNYTVETKLFSVEFIIYPGSSYMSEKIVFKGSLQDVVNIHM